MSKSKNLFGQGFLCYDTLKTAGWPLDLLLLGPGLTPDPIRNECVCVCVCVFEDNHIRWIKDTEGIPHSMKVVGREFPLQRVTGMVINMCGKKKKKSS